MNKSDEVIKQLSKLKNPKKARLLAGLLGSEIWGYNTKTTCGKN